MPRTLLPNEEKDLCGDRDDRPEYDGQPYELQGETVDGKGKQASFN